MGQDSVFDSEPPSHLQELPVAAAAGRRTPRIHGVYILHEKRKRVQMAGHGTTRQRGNDSGHVPT